MKKIWRRLPLGPLQTNCYLYADAEGHCLIIDPGEEANKLIQVIREKKWKPLAILLTHAHFDHIGALDAVREYYEIPAYVHIKERNWLQDSSLNGSAFFEIGGPVQARVAEHIIESEGTLEIGDFKLDVLYTPGHSPGSVSYYDQKEGVVFSGDALFKGSIGRTDLPGGNHQQLLDSIQKKLLTLPEDTLCLSGHGPETIIEDEMMHNPFLNGF